MKKQILVIIIGMVFLSLASAIYAGECLSVDLSELESLDNVVYDVVGNSSNLEGLKIELNGTIANICVVTNYRPDSFTIIFIDNSTKETIIEVEVPSDCPSCGSRSTRTIYKDRDVIVEVDNYIDREVIINNTIIGIEDTTKPIIEEEMKKKIPWHVWMIGGLLILAILFFYFAFFRKSHSLNHASHEHALHEEETYTNEKEEFEK